MTPDGIGGVAFVTAQRRTPPRSDRETPGGWSQDFFAFAVFCSSNFRMWASNSDSLAHPLKSWHSISNVRFVGLCPDHNEITRLAINAKYS